MEIRDESVLILCRDGYLASCKWQILGRKLRVLKLRLLKLMRVMILELLAWDITIYSQIFSLPSIRAVHLEQTELSYSFYLLLAQNH